MSLETVGGNLTAVGAGARCRTQIFRKGGGATVTFDNAATPAVAEPTDFIPAFPAIRRGMPNAAVALYTLFKNPLELLTQRHHDEGLVIDTMFGIRAFSLNDPDFIHQIFVTHRGRYGIDPIRKLLLNRGFEQGLASVEGEAWQSLRKLAATEFTPKKREQFGAQIATMSREFCRRQPGPQTVPLARLMTSLAMDNAMACLFSIHRDASFDAMMETNSNYLEHGMAIDPLDVFRLPSALPRLMKKPIRGIERRHRKLVDMLYQNRCEQIAAGRAVPEDLLTAICRHFMQEADPSKARRAALDNIGTMFGASYDTTSKIISWALYLTSQSPSTLERLRAEIDSGNHDSLPPIQWPSALPLTLATIRETARLYPPVPGMVRYAREEDVVGDHDVKPGDFLVASIWLLQRSDRHWKNGTCFDIDRFLPGGEAERKPGCYMPFGTGPRTCIGRHFAELEAVIVLATVLRHFEFHYDGAKPPKPVWKGTVRSDNGLPMTMIRR